MISWRSKNGINHFECSLYHIGINTTFRTGRVNDWQVSYSLEEFSCSVYYLVLETSGNRCWPGFLILKEWKTSLLTSCARVRSDSFKFTRVFWCRVVENRSIDLTSDSDDLFKVKWETLHLTTNELLPESSLAVSQIIFLFLSVSTEFSFSWEKRYHFPRLDVCPLI